QASFVLLLRRHVAGGHVANQVGVSCIAIARLPDAGFRNRGGKVLVAHEGAEALECWKDIRTDRLLCGGSEPLFFLIGKCRRHVLEGGVEAVSGWVLI